MPRKRPRPQAKKWAARRKARAATKPPRRADRQARIEETSPVTLGLYAMLAAMKLHKDT